MQPPWTIDLIWWITAVEMPMLGGLFWLAWRTRNDAEASLDDARHDFETGLSLIREKLSAFKLEVAKSYASIAYLKEVERRLTHHLLRIEDKLDRTSHKGNDDE
jgi:hypothetical protein